MYRIVNNQTLEHHLVFSDPSFHFIFCQIKSLYIRFHKLSVGNRSIQRTTINHMSLMKEIECATCAIVCYFFHCFFFSLEFDRANSQLTDHTIPVRRRRKRIQLKLFRPRYCYLEVLALSTKSSKCTYRISVSFSSFMRYCWKSSCINARPSLLHFFALANLEYKT